MWICFIVFLYVLFVFIILNKVEIYKGIIGIVEFVCVIIVFNEDIYVLLFKFFVDFLIVCVVWLRFFLVLLIVVWL